MDKKKTTQAFWLFFFFFPELVMVTYGVSSGWCSSPAGQGCLSAPSLPQAVSAPFLPQGEAWSGQWEEQREGVFRICELISARKCFLIPC